MAKDYSGALALAQRSMLKFGRPVDVLKESRVKINSDQPWLGTATAVTRVEDVYGVFVPVAGDQTVSRVAEEMGAMRRRVDTFLIASDGVNDLTQFQKIVDGSKIWRIGVVHVIAPGDTVLLYQIEVSGAA